MTPTEEQAALKIRLMQNSIEDGDCLIWIGAQDRHGYGSVRWNGRTNLVHRLGFFCHTGEIPKLNILHKCDNPLCWKEEHLFEGTQQDNISDMIVKGRASLINPSIGSSNGSSRLTEVDVVEIKQMLKKGYSQRDIADTFGVRQSTITHINVGRTWTHV